MRHHDQHGHEAMPALIEATAPVRICDLGGWTDTWFGGPGRVVNLGVAPGVTVAIREHDGPEPVVLDVGAYGHRYPVTPRAARTPRHPLLEAAIDAVPPPAGRRVVIDVRSAVPSGCGAGTSAAIAVALLGALHAWRGDAVDPRVVADAAHHLEVDGLGQESGVQDQLSAAFGGISSITIDPYPDAAVEALPAWPGLSTRLSLVFLGRPHRSSALHEQVIEHVQGRPAPVFDRLRDAANAARDAVLAQDLAAFGAAMVANTDAQDALHPALVGDDARRTIEIARERGALGWKVNGAGGDGGSVTFLSPTAEAKSELEASIVAADLDYGVLPVAISDRGLEIQAT
jgi:D-glycero-alpha-D-manno-heptose-7-phosphate kinase